MRQATYRASSTTRKDGEESVSDGGGGLPGPSACDRHIRSDSRDRPENGPGVLIMTERPPSPSQIIRPVPLPAPGRRCV